MTYVTKPLNRELPYACLRGLLKIVVDRDRKALPALP